MESLLHAAVLSSEGKITNALHTTQNRVQQLTSKATSTHTIFSHTLSQSKVYTNGYEVFLLQAIPMRNTVSVELKHTQICTKLFKKHSHYKSYKSSSSQSFQTLCIPRAMLSKALQNASKHKVPLGTLTQTLEMQNHPLHKQKPHRYCISLPSPHLLKIWLSKNPTKIPRLTPLPNPCRIHDQPANEVKLPWPTRTHPKWLPIQAVSKHKHSKLEPRENRIE